MSQLITYLHYPFVVYALIAGVLITISSSLFGVTLVLKRYSLLGDGLAHVAFTAAAIASILRLAVPMCLTLPLTIVVAILLLRKETHGDATIAVVSVGSLALGYLLMNLFPSSGNMSGDVCSTLFGSTSILTLTPSDVWICAGTTVFVVAAFMLFYNKILAITFDPVFMVATGVPTKVYSTFMAAVIGAVVVLAMDLVGSLLVSALIVFPAISAMQVCKSFKSVTICSTICAVLGTVLGILVSILLGTPVGSTIVGIDVIIFVGFYCLGRLKS